MQVGKRWNFGAGTIFSLIVVYFIFLYSRDKNWTTLAFISKWYLIIVIGLSLLSVAIVLLVVLISLVMLLVAAIRLRKLKKSQKSKNYVDVEYKIKE